MVINIKHEIIWVGIVAVSLSCSAYAQNRQLVQAEASPRQLNVQVLMKQRQESVTELIRFVDAKIKKRNGIQEAMLLNAAIDLLGDYRAKEAVSLLIENVDARVSTISLAVTPFTGFPSVGALVKIGNPATQAILKRMNSTSEYNENDLHLFAYIIREIDGEEIGKFRLQQASKGAIGSHKINLLNLIEIYNLKESEFDIKKKLVKPSP